MSVLRPALTSSRHVSRHNERTACSRGGRRAGAGPNGTRRPGASTKKEPSGFCARFRVRAGGLTHRTLFGFVDTMESTHQPSSSVRTHVAFNFKYTLGAKEFLKSKFLSLFSINLRRQFKHLISLTLLAYPHPAVGRHVLGLTVDGILRFGLAHLYRR